MLCTKNHTNICPDNYRTLDLDGKKALYYGQHAYVASYYCGCFLRVKVNGKPKTWKRNLERVQIPYKYGLYEYGYLTELDTIRQAG